MTTDIINITICIKCTWINCWTPIILKTFYILIDCILITIIWRTCKSYNNAIAVAILIIRDIITNHVLSLLSKNVLKNDVINEVQSGASL